MFQRFKHQFGKSLQMILFVLMLLTLHTGISAQTADESAKFAEKLHFGSIEEKRDVLYELRNLRTEEASRIAIIALNDPAEIVRATAAAAIVFVGSGEAANLLKQSLNDKSAFVRREAVYALGKVRNSNSVTPLINVLQNDKKPEVRLAAAIALGQIGNPSAINPLTEILELKPKSSQAFFRRSVALSIGQIARMIQIRNYPDVIPDVFFESSAMENGDLKYEDLTRSIPEFKQTSNVLIRMLQDRKEPDLAKREAAFALGEIADQNALAVLKEKMNSEDDYLASIAFRSSKKILNALPDGNKDIK